MGSFENINSSDPRGLLERIHHSITAAIEEIPVWPCRPDQMTPREAQIANQVERLLGTIKAIRSWTEPKAQSGKTVYLDHNATTAIDPLVREAMQPFLQEQWANPSSNYRPARQVTEAIKWARKTVADLIRAEPNEIFTSCGTESNNTAWHSAVESQPACHHVITTAVEHASVLAFAARLRKKGYEITILPVDSEGRMDVKMLEKAIRPDTALVSVMQANNETGAIFPIEDVANLCHQTRTQLHVDAVQAPGKLPIYAAQKGITYLSLSGHKIHAPKGTGLLYVKANAPFQPYLPGSQERKRRGGTENVPGIIGFGKAAGLTLRHPVESIRRM